MRTGYLYLYIDACPRPRDLTLTRATRSPRSPRSARSFARAIGVPFTLSFDPFAVIVMTMSVILASFVMADGRSNWFLGLQLLLTYSFVAFVFLFAKE